MGALAVCIIVMVLDTGLFAIFEGIAMWVVSQILIFPLALLTAPFGALLRMILGFIFDQPSPVALLTGAIIGTLGASFIAYSANDGWNAWLLILAVGAFAGLVGGWTWLRIEKRFLDAT